MALVAACAADSPSRSLAQMGGMGPAGMAPTGGIFNGAVTRLQNLNANGPGWMYYGINAADRGLGYRGSYMTLGAFIPYAEDDLGGFWSADLRSHLSNYGGFFSNVGFVRKQFIGGAIGGIGVYWDYDGDQNQYSTTTIKDDSGSYTFAGGQTYQQVGISAEFLTDYGNLRSNGYIPCGNTASTMGPFVGNSLLCQYGINAGLAGADLELGAYIPGLSDWAGMISVGGYTFGNARYNLSNGQNVVPYFGGVYTRLDLTLATNWDFSLQANDDSYFDWTGFARLTYRMGGSRRRNVPDQMEQPMMRNEHIVRAHQAPEQAINPVTMMPWKVIHVDNSFTAGTTTGAGTAENPVMTLQEAQVKATQDYDIVFVHRGTSAECPYNTGPDGFTFQANHQYLVGQGSSLKVCTANCGLIPIWSDTQSSLYPVITNPDGPAIVLSGNNNTVDHFKISGALVGISNNGASVPLATVNDVQIFGTGPGQTGVVIASGSDGAGDGVYNFTAMNLQNLTSDGFVVYGTGTTGSTVFEPTVNISNSTIKNTSGSAVVVDNLGEQGRVGLVNSAVIGTTGPGVSISGANAIVQSSTFAKIGTYGVAVTGSPIISGSTGGSGTSTVQVVDSVIVATIGVQASAPTAGEVVNLTVNGNSMAAPFGGNGINLAVGDGKINANLVDNRISALPTTALFSGSSSTSTSTSTGNGAPLASGIYLTTTGTGANLNNLTIKAAGQDNLVALNRNVTVTSQPLVSGSAPPPPPPNYNPSAIVPLPPP